MHSSPNEYTEVREMSVTPRPLYPRGKAPGTHCIGGWVGPRVALDTVEKRITSATA
jgi:hypothetical protein